jgi:hypothetical protein
VLFGLCPEGAASQGEPNARAMLRGGSAGSVTQSGEPMQQNRIRGLPRRVPEQLIAKSRAIEVSLVASVGVRLQAVELAAGGRRARARAPRQRSRPKRLARLPITAPASAEGKRRRRHQRRTGRQEAARRRPRHDRAAEDPAGAGPLSGKVRVQAAPPVPKPATPWRRLPGGLLRRQPAAGPCLTLADVAMVLVVE